MLALVPLKGTRTKSAVSLSFLWFSSGIDHFALHLLALKLLAERQIRIHLQRLITSSPLPFWIRIHMMRSLQSCFGSEAPITFNKFSYKFGTQSSINHHFFHSEQPILERKSRKVFQSGKVVEKICSFNPRLVGPSMVVKARGMDLNVVGGDKSLLRRYPHVLSPNLPAQNLLKCNGWEAQRLIFTA